ncbi:MAG TPA: OsmC family protein [Candidatus Dormibacteraeota bacterium]|nr:OsmC family protein [Candidatus Dormibacteraeota bacterium]
MATPCSTDQPAGDGGDDTAPTPTELFVAGLAACAGYYAERFLRRHAVPAAGLEVRCGYTWSENPHRVGAIAIKVDAPGLPDLLRPAFIRVVEHCTVHNTLVQPPAITLEVAHRDVAAGVTPAR